MTAVPVVLLTRPERSNESLAALLRESGVTVRVCPAVRLIPLLGDNEINGAWMRWRSDAGRGLVVVTSAETVRLLQTAGVCIDVPVAAVGPASASAVRQAGWESLDVIASAAASLADALIDGELARGRDIWLPQSRQAGGELARALGQAGNRVTTTALYEPVAQTAELRQAVADGNIDLAVFFSGSAVRAFADAAPAWAGQIVCIGSSTATVARERGWTNVSFASAPSDEAMMRAILDALAATGKAG